jgi:hypothetical protein
MTSSSDPISLGFLVGIYFLASAVVAMTLVYFSRPKPKVTGSKTRANPAKAKTRDGSPTKAPVPLSQPELAAGVAAPKPGPEVEAGKPDESTAKAEKPMAGAPPLQPVPSVKDRSPRAEEPKSPEAPTAPQAQAAISPTPAAGQAKMAEPEKTSENRQTAAAAGGTGIMPNTGATGAEASKPFQPNPGTEIKTEAQGEKEMEKKPQSAKPSDDFSELFTEDNSEENEVSKLARQLEEVDTQSILAESKNLIDQLRKGKG